MSGETTLYVYFPLAQGMSGETTLYVRRVAVGADVERRLAAHPLRQGEVDVGPRRLAQPGVGGVGDHADDLHRGLGADELEALAERALRREVAPRQGLVDDRDRPAVGAVGGGEAATAEERDAEGLEVDAVAT